MSPLLMEGDIRAPEVWVRVDSHGRRAAPIGVPEPLPRSWTASWRSQRRPGALPRGGGVPCLGRRRRSREHGAPTNHDLKQEADRTAGYQDSARYACTAAVFADLRHGPVGSQSGDV